MTYEERQTRIDELTHQIFELQEERTVLQTEQTIDELSLYSNKFFKYNNEASGGIELLRTYDVDDCNVLHATLLNYIPPNTASDKHGQYYIEEVHFYSSNQLRHYTEIDIADFDRYAVEFADLTRDIILNEFKYQHSANPTYEFEYEDMDIDF